MLYHIADRLIGIESHVGSHDNIGKSPEDVEGAFVQNPSSMTYSLLKWVNHSASSNSL